MKYWVYHEGEVPGAYEPEGLAKLPGFTSASLVCPADSSAEERRWQRAGLYPDIVDALRIHDLQPPPTAPAAAATYADPSSATGPDELLNATSHRIFLHVTELMKELENRREERALTQSLQRSLVELKSELHAARERIRFLDDRISTIPALEERERRAQEESERVRAEIKAMDERVRERDARISQMEQRLHEAALALDNALRGQTDAVREQKRMAQVVEELNRQLAQKESSLAKSLGMIRRLESELGHLLPGLSGKTGGTPVKTAAMTPPPPPPALVTAAGQPQPQPVNRGGAQPAALPDIPKLAPNPVVEEGAPSASVATVRTPEIVPLSAEATPILATPILPSEDEEDAVQPSKDEPAAGPKPTEKVTPVPAPWQSALDEVTKFFKRNMPGEPPETK